MQTAQFFLATSNDPIILAHTVNVWETLIFCMDTCGKEVTNSSDTIFVKPCYLFLFAVQKYDRRSAVLIEAMLFVFRGTGFVFFIPKLFFSTWAATNFDFLTHCKKCLHKLNLTFTRR